MATPVLCVGCVADGETAEEAPQSTPAAASKSAEAEQADPQLDRLRATVAADPDNAEARRSLAIALHSALLREEAVGHFEWLAKRDPTPRSLLDLALSYSSVARIEESAATYERLLALVPNHPIALHNLGNLHYKGGEVERSIEYYRRSITAQPDYLLAHFHLGQALELAEQYREAYRTYEKVLELEPTSAEEMTAYDDALYHLASLDITMGAYQRAGGFLEELLKANPEHPSGYYAYGQVLLQLGRAEDAQRAFEAHARVMAKQKPTSPMAHGE